MKNTTKLLCWFSFFAVAVANAFADQPLLDQLAGVKGKQPPPLTERKHHEQTLDDIEAEIYSWTRKCLNDEWLPPEKSNYVLLPAKAEKDADKAIVRYEVAKAGGERGHMVTVTQLSAVFAVEVTRTDEKKGPLSPKEADNLARKILKLPKDADYKLVVNKEGTAGEMFLDLKVVKNRDFPAFAWEIRWWQDEQRIGFYFLKRQKTQGGDSVEVDLFDEAWDLDANRTWFKHALDVLSRPLVYKDDENKSP